MDESYLANNSSMKKPRRFSRQVEKTSNKINSTSDAELVSIDDISNTDAKSSLLTRKQRIKEYLTFVSENNTAPTKLLQDIHNDELTNFVSTIDDYNKPVKVKSLWTRTSQMEEALENSSFLQTEITSPKNNLSTDIINEASTMAIPPVNIINKSNNTMNNISVNNHNIDLRKSCSVVLEKMDLIKLHPDQKKKRGRPKKKVINNQEKSPVAFNVESKDLIEPDSLNELKPENSDTPPTPLPIKRGRGRPKKNGNTTTLKPQDIFKKKKYKKKGRKKRTNVKKTLKKMESFSLENKTTLEVSNDSESSTLDVNADILNTEECISVDNVLINENSITSCESKSNDNTRKNKKNMTSQLGMSCAVYLEKLDTFKEQRKSASITNPKVETINSLKDIKQDFIIKFDKANWNIVSNQVKSNSHNEYTKIRHRRNSLSDNFVYDLSDFSKIKNDDKPLQKSWKSLSYLQGGPNIQIERYQHNELHKKFRKELKRSRSFPNCMLLDTIIWRFLVNEQTNYTDDCFMFSDSEIDLLNELSVYEYNHEYRSKSIPLEQCEYKNESNKFLSRSLDSLNMLCYTKNLPPFQINPGESDLKNTESDSDERENKIRRSKRLNTKIKDMDMIDEKYLQESDNAKSNYLLLAEEIRKENERQLLEARKNDQELEKKLKKLGFTLITNNLFRPDRKNMGEYTPAEAQELRKLKPRRIINADTYICHCKYSRKDWKDGKPGCGSLCINRLLNIECGSACSLKSFCTNKQFQNKQFKRTEIARTPNKGYGVFALEDIPRDTFVDEYMGEVIDQHQMIKRMKTKLYKNNNYMVQLKHDEIIDATRKGNITRFINHSCEPNCVAEKWNVLGESRMGFFTTVPILKGEEITFDYSFEIFGDAAQQKCYCNAPKCRGFISRKSRTGDQSSSDESDDNGDDVLVLKPEEQEQKKKKITVKKITNKDRKRLRELDKQLTDISKLKNKNRSDLENSTLNLNKLMVHITDSMSRSHILKFIRENDYNCKRLFMNFNGLSIIHSWMTSSNNENLKLEIIETLSELPISNRNTISKSKVLDIVAEWANIPFNIKEKIENLDYPVSKSEERGREINKLLPYDKNISLLAQTARELWKKWIILKMVFKIPKLERPKEVNLPECLKMDVHGLTQIVTEPTTTTSQYSKLNNENLTNRFNYITSAQSQKISDHGIIYGMDSFSKMVQSQMYNKEKNKAIIEWNKKYSYNTSRETNKLKSSELNNSNNFNLNTNHDSTSKFPSNEILEIPTIEGILQSKKVKRSNTAEFTPAVFEVPTCDSPPKSTSTHNIPEIEHTDYNSIEVITNINKTWNPPPTADELQNRFTLESILKTVPPCVSNSYVSNQYDNTIQYFNLYDSMDLMGPENVMYEAQHPSIEEQLSHYRFTESQLNDPPKTVIDILKTNSKEIDSNKNSVVIQPVNAEDTQKLLYEKCQNNIKKLFDSGLLDITKSARENFLDRTPIKITNSFFKKKFKNSQSQNKNDLDLPNFFKRLKVLTNFYQEQPSKLVKISNYNSKCIAMKNINDINDTFRITEEVKTEKTEKTDATTIAFNFYNEQLSTAPQNLNLRKLLKKHKVELNTDNKFAIKLFNGYKKRYSKMPKQFTLKLPSDAKIHTHDPVKEIELHNKLIPTVKNTLCARLIKKDGEDPINVFKQEIIMKYNESKTPGPLLTLEEIFKKNFTAPKNNTVTIDENPIKRKMPLNISNKIKRLKTVDSPISKTINQVTVTNETNDDVTLRMPMLSMISKKSPHVNTTANSKRREVSSKQMSLKMAVLKNANTIEQKPSTSSQVMSSNTPLNVSASEVIQEYLNQDPSLLNQLSPINDLLKTNFKEIRQKPLMKCLPFNKVDNISAIELEQNAKNLATYLSMNYSSTELPISPIGNELIDPIVDNFNASINLNKTMNRTNLVNDPIVRDYIQRTQIKTLESQRKCKLPDSMMSLPVEVLNLVPDNQREIKYVIDFYHSMATVIVKILDSYVKKTCKQGRIKNDEDFKYLAKKLNSNILFKELQVKRVEDLKISDSVKQKVEQYIKKYMLKYGKVYRRKSTDQ